MQRQSYDESGSHIGFTERRRKRRNNYARLKRLKLEAVLTQNSTDGAALEELGRLLFDEGKLLKSIQCNSLAIESGRRSAALFATLGCALYELGQSQDALDAFCKTRSLAHSENVALDMETCSYMARSFALHWMVRDAFHISCTGLDEVNGTVNAEQFYSHKRFGGPGAFMVYAGTLATENGLYDQALRFYENAHRVSEEALVPYDMQDVWVCVAKAYNMLGEIELENAALQVVGTATQTAELWASIAAKHEYQHDFIGAAEFLYEAHVREPWNPLYLRGILRCVERGRLKSVDDAERKRLKRCFQLAEQNQSQKLSVQDTADTQPRTAITDIPLFSRSTFEKTHRGKKRSKFKRKKNLAAQEKPLTPDARPHRLAPIPRDERKPHLKKTSTPPSKERIPQTVPRDNENAVQEKSDIRSTQEKSASINNPVVLSSIQMSQARRQSQNLTSSQKAGAATGRFRPRLMTKQISKSPFRRDSRLNNPYEDGRLNPDLLKHRHSISSTESKTPTGRRKSRDSVFSDTTTDSQEADHGANSETTGVEHGMKTAAPLGKNISQDNSEDPPPIEDQAVEKVDVDVEEDPLDGSVDEEGDTQQVAQENSQRKDIQDDDTRSKSAEEDVLAQEEGDSFAQEEDGKMTPAKAARIARRSTVIPEFDMLQPEPIVGLEMYEEAMNEEHKHEKGRDFEEETKDTDQQEEKEKKEDPQSKITINEKSPIVRARKETVIPMLETFEMETMDASFKVAGVGTSAKSTISPDLFQITEIEPPASILAPANLKGEEEGQGDVGGVSDVIQQESRSQENPSPRSARSSSKRSSSSPIDEAEAFLRQIREEDDAKLSRLVSNISSASAGSKKTEPKDETSLAKHPTSPQLAQESVDQAKALLDELNFESSDSDVMDEDDDVLSIYADDWKPKQ